MSTPNPATDLGVGVSLQTDVGAVANALAALFKLADGIVIMLNSPQMLAARKNADVHAALERMDQDLKDAQRTGDLTQADRDASG